MRLYLAVAVLMLAFVAYTEAQEETFEETLTRLSGRVTDAGRGLFERAKTAVQEIKNNDYVVQSRSWIEDRFEQLKRSMMN